MIRKFVTLSGKKLLKGISQSVCGFVFKDIIFHKEAGVPGSVFQRQ